MLSEALGALMLSALLAMIASDSIVRRRLIWASIICLGVAGFRIGLASLLGLLKPQELLIAGVLGIVVGSVTTLLAEVYERSWIDAPKNVENAIAANPHPPSAKAAEPGNPLTSS